MNQKKIKTLFAVMLPILFSQMYYCHHYTEPFPAIMMPRFGYQQPLVDAVEYKDVELVFISPKGAEFPISRHDLLESMHLPQRFNGVSSVFSLDSKAADDPEFKQWLQGRVFALTQHSEGRLEATWHKIQIAKNRGGVTRTRENIGVKTIEIQG